MNEILQAAAQVKLLVTSRSLLNLQAESGLAVSGMAVPETLPEDLEELYQHSSLQLFMQAARRAAPGFAPDRAALEQVLRICRLVGGMPLGILLAAAWLRMLGPGEIAEEIAAHSLDFLEGEWQEVPERQRSLRAVFDYSWGLLSAREQQVFAGLAVFRGGFSYPAAQQVCGAGLRDLLKLVNHSLLERAPDGRYRLHELLRQYGAEQLAAQPQAARAAGERHAEYYAGQLERLWADYRGPRQLEALAELELESDNARAAWDWAAAQARTELLARGIAGLGWFYLIRCRYADGEQAFRLAAEGLAGSGAQAAAVWAGLRSWQGRFCLELGRMEAGRELMFDGLARLRAAAAAGQDVRGYLAEALWMPSYWEANQAARELLLENLALYRDLDDRWGVGHSLFWLGNMAQTAGEHTVAVGYYQESLALWRALGVQLDIAETQEWLAHVLGLMGRIEEAEKLARENAALCRRLGDPNRLAGALHVLGASLINAGKYLEAAGPLAECIGLCEKQGNHNLLGRALLRLVRVEAAQADYGAARAAAERSFKINQERKSGLLGSAGWHLGELALAQGQWGEAQHRLAEGLTLMRAAGSRGAYGIPTAELGLTALRLGEPERGRGLLGEALALSATLGNLETPICALPVAAAFAAEAGQAERAVELYALAERYGFIANSAMWHDIAGQPVAAAAAGLPPELAAAARARGQARELQATIAELAQEYA